MQTEYAWWAKYAFSVLSLATVQRFLLFHWKEFFFSYNYFFFEYSTSIKEDFMER